MIPANAFCRFSEEVLSYLLIDAGDLPSLVALALESSPNRAILWHPRGEDPAAGRREAAVLEHAAAYGAVSAEAVRVPPVEVGGESRGLDEGCLLLHAAGAARRHGCPRIVWPRQVGFEPDLVEEAVQRARLAADLAQVGPGGAGRGELLVDLPVIDLTDVQLADLAEDSGAPPASFWPCGEDGQVPCERCDGCRRWRAAFDGAGVAWPWEAVGAAG